ncbi:MAG TPA: histone deacetylase [Acidimicrobiia bacterium]|nr:histone deacetylase [Acidimicrobiia bacterium]
MLLYGADPAFLEHDTGRGHPERPTRLGAARAGVAAAGLEEAVVAVEARDATRAELERVHTPRYLDALDAFIEGGGGRLDPDTVASAGSLHAARLAAGLGLAAVERLRADPACGPAFLAVRPPGHHAVADRAMGFCLYNNAAVVAASLAAAGERVAVIDWDAHHGNGTQDIFYEDGRVLYISLHQSPLYPGTGRLAERGTGAGAGATLNLPMPPGSTGDVYLAAFDEVVEPVVERFAPEWVLVSAGFDAHRDDPLTDLGLTSGDFGDLAARVASLAPSPNRIVAFLEGGYDLEAVTASVAATLLTWAEGSAAHPEPPSSGGPGRSVVDAARELTAI